MNSARVCTVMFGSLPFSAAWEVAVHAAADGKPPTELVAAGVAPQVIAAVLILAAFLDPQNRSDESDQQPTGPTPRQLRRAAVEAARRRELVR